MLFRKLKRTELFSKGDLVKVEKVSSLPNDKDYYIVIDYVYSHLNEEDELDQNSMFGIVWGLTEKDIIQNELHVRLWNDQLKKYYIIAEKYLQKI